MSKEIFTYKEIELEVEYHYQKEEGHIGSDSWHYCPPEIEVYEVHLYDSETDETHKTDILHLLDLDDFIDKFYEFLEKNE